MNDITGKVAIITGGAKGIGRTIAEEFAKHGCKVAMIGRDIEAGSKAEEELSELTTAKFYQCDVSSTDNIKETFDKIISDLGGADILINNAGMPIRDKIEEIDSDKWDRYMAVNTKSAFFFSQIFAEYIKANNTGYGRIINISSVRAKVVDETHAGYTITKAAMNAMTKCFAVSYGAYGVTANAIAPAFVLTPMTEHYLQHPQAAEVIKTIAPIGRPLEQEEIANAALFFALPASGGVSGQVLYLDGGGFSYTGVYA